MSVFADMADKFEKAASLVPSLVDSSIEATEGQLLDFNREQLDKGKRSDSQNITPDYSLPYAKRKGFKTPNLKVTGEFHRSLSAKIKARSIEIEGKRQNKGFDVAAHLEKRYTSNIYGLTDSNQTKYNKIFLPVFQKQLSDELQ